MEDEAAQVERERQEVEALRAQMAAEEAALAGMAADQAAFLAELAAEEEAVAHGPPDQAPVPAPDEANPTGAAAGPAAEPAAAEDEAAAQVERERREVEALRAQMAAEEQALEETRLAMLHEEAHGDGASQATVVVADIAEAEHRLRGQWLTEGEVGTRNRREEMVYDSIGGVVMRDPAGALVTGWLVVTSYRVTFLPRAAALASATPTTVMLCGIDEIEPLREMPVGPAGLTLKYAHLRLRAKDSRVLHFILDEGLDASLAQDEHTSLSSIAEMMRFQGGGAESTGGGRKRFLTKFKVPGQTDEAETMSPELTRLHEFHQKSVAQMRAQSCEAPRGNDSPYQEAPQASDSAELGYFDMGAEFSRMGVGTRADSYWRLTQANANFELCSTYPRLLAAPKITTDEELIEVAKFRSKQRLPMLTWVNPETHAAIVRCAQPLVGISAHHSDADESLFKTIERSNPGAGGLLVADARPYANAIANKGRKGGFEDVSKYEDSNTELIFLNIDNIHVMRRSLQEMHELVCAPDRTEPARLSDVLATGWLSFVGRLLGGAAKMVEVVGTQNRTVIVHCSDGWDRTAQLSGLAQLCLDPYYRTCAGFQVLFQKEWNAFGHKCRDRTWGHKLHERSPIMMQFLDAVHQVMYTYPEAFEFNELLLIKIVDALVSNVYSDFRFNNERERSESLAGVASVDDRFSADEAPGCPSSSLWHILHDDAAAAELRSSRYDATAFPGIIRPPMHARVWTAYFNRWIADPIGGRPEKILGVAAPAGAPGAHGRTSARPTVFGLSETTPRHKGWMWKEGKRHKEFKRRQFVLYDAVDGEAALVYYEEEKSGALAPKGMIALRQGAYALRKPKRKRADYPHAFRLDIALSDSASQGAADKATGTVKALMHRRGSDSSPVDADAATAAATAAAKGGKKKTRFPGRRRSVEDTPHDSALDTAAMDSAHMPVSGGNFSTAAPGAASASGSELAAKKTMKYILAPETEAELEMWMQVLDSTLGTSFAEAAAAAAAREESSSDEDDGEEDEQDDQSSGLMAKARGGLRAGVRRMSNKGAEDAAAAAAAAAMFGETGAGGDYTGLSEGVPPRRALRSSRAPDPEEEEIADGGDAEAQLQEKMEEWLDDEDEDDEGARATLVAFEGLSSPSKSTTATADALRMRMSMRAPALED